MQTSCCQKYSCSYSTLLWRMANHSLQVMLASFPGCEWYGTGGSFPLSAEEVSKLQLPPLWCHPWLDQMMPQAKAFLLVSHCLQMCSGKSNSENVLVCIYVITGIHRHFCYRKLFHIVPLFMSEIHGLVVFSEQRKLEKLDTCAEHRCWKCQEESTIKPIAVMLKWLHKMIRQMLQNTNTWPEEAF